MSTTRRPVPTTPDPGPPPASRGFVMALLVALPVLLLAGGLWLIAIAVERATEARGGIAPADRWLAAPAANALERIGFGSCLDQTRAQPVWKSVLAQRPQLFLMMGDNVYGDVKGPELRELRAAYAAAARHPEFAAARVRVPFLATWDDHDYGLNDASASFPWKAGTRQLFAEFWQVRERELPVEGVYRARIFGPPGRRVQVILLDLRSFRSAFAEAPLTERKIVSAKYTADRSPARTMLGEAQWSWLANELRQPAEIRLIVSSIQLLAEGHGWERWGHFPAERDRLLRLLGETGARGAIVLSGDRHRAGIYRRQSDLPYALHEVTSSALNRSFDRPEPDDPARIGDMYGGDNFGMVAIDWAARRLAVTINRADDGRAARTLELTFGQLGLQ